ncbi:MAG: NAD(P)/FAD-dependent oxidoreductase [Anaerolineae bacterium]
MILVGDAARHVNPITGGGIHTALRGGMIAGNFLARFLSTGQRPTAKNLAPYQQLWFDELGHAMQNLYNLKRRIFRQKDVFKQDQLLHQTLAGYFHPASEFRKV